MWSSDTKTYMHYKTMTIIYRAEQSRRSLRTPSMPRAGYPTLLAWRGRGTIYSGSRPAGVTTRSPRMVTECLLTRSMLIKMYLPVFMVCAFICTLYLQSVNHLVKSLSSCINVLFDTTILTESVHISLSLQ